MTINTVKDFLMKRSYTEEITDRMEVPEKGCTAEEKTDLQTAIDRLPPKPREPSHGLE